MKSNTGHFSTVTALVRTTEWQVDTARAAYVAADETNSKAMAERDDALRSTAEAEQLTRDLFRRVPLNADILRLAALNQTQANQDLEQKERHHDVTNDALELARQELLEARTKARIFRRLLERRKSVQQLEVVRTGHHDADDAGAIRTIFKMSTDYTVTLEERYCGN